MNKTKVIAGVVVDAAKAKSVENGVYTVAGLSCDWSIIEAGEAVIRGEQRPQGLTKDPAFCQACREIYNRYHKSLKHYNFLKGLNEKGEKTHNILAGVACNDRVYERFKDKEYIIPGTTIPQTLQQISRHYEKYGEYMNAEEATAYKDVISKAAAEIENETDKNGGFFTMEYKSFKDYLTDSSEVFTAARREYIRLIESMEEAKKNYLETQSNFSKYSDYDRIIAKATFMQTEKSVNEAIEALQEKTKKSISAIRASMADAVKEFYFADPSKLDNNTMTLLNSGAYTDAELMEVAERNRSNPTMLRMIKNEAEKRNSKEARRVSFELRKATDGTAELDVFDKLTHWQLSALSPRSSLSMPGMIEKYYDEVYRECLSDIDNTFAKPEVTDNAE